MCLWALLCDSNQTQVKFFSLFSTVWLCLQTAQMSWSGDFCTDRWLQTKPIALLLAHACGGNKARELMAGCHDLIETKHSVVFISCIPQTEAIMIARVHDWQHSRSGADQLDICLLCFTQYRTPAVPATDGKKIPKSTWKTNKHDFMATCTSLYSVWWKYFLSNIVCIVSWTLLFFCERPNRLHGIYSSQPGTGSACTLISIPLIPLPLLFSRSYKTLNVPCISQSMEEDHLEHGCIVDLV